MGFVETFADSLKEMPPAPMGEALRPLWHEALADIKAEHEAGADGQVVARRITEAMDAVVLSIYQSAMPQTSGPHALVALGGYGRCEMAPHSDVDLLFLFAKSQDKLPKLSPAYSIRSGTWGLRWGIAVARWTRWSGRCAKIWNRAPR